MVVSASSSRRRADLPCPLRPTGTGTHIATLHTDCVCILFHKECSNQRFNRPCLSVAGQRLALYAAELSLPTTTTDKPQVSNGTAVKKEILSEKENAPRCCSYTFSETKAVRKISSASRQDISRGHCAACVCI